MAAPHTTVAFSDSALVSDPSGSRQTSTRGGSGAAGRLLSLAAMLCIDGGSALGLRTVPGTRAARQCRATSQVMRSAQVDRLGRPRCCDDGDEGFDSVFNDAIDLDLLIPPEDELAASPLGLASLADDDTAADPAKTEAELSGIAEGEWEMSEENGAQVLRVVVAGQLMRFETGVIGRLASGAVNTVVGSTHVFSTACLQRDAEVKPIDFTPLRVDYFERSSSVGRTPGGYIKRDGRPSDAETLVARLIDRPIRPLIAPGWSCETQLVSYVLAYDMKHLPDVLAVCGASAALAISEVPFPKPVAAVRIAMGDGELIVNPRSAQAAKATLDLVIAGTKEAVMMVEGSADFVPEDKVIEALEVGMKAVRTIASAIGAWAEAIGAPTFERGLRDIPSGLMQELRSLDIDGKTMAERLAESLVGDSKKGREQAANDLKAEALAKLTVATEGDPDQPVFEAADVKSAFKDLACALQREIVSETGRRSDGRSTTEVRPIDIRMSPLPPQVHGSVLFTRGETQSLGTATLGDAKMAQRYENLAGDQSKNFYLQYAFPPFSVGEVGRIGTPGRREIGHGNLAERALRPAVPPASEFQYVVRVESLITESCGSSSMASVCAGCLSMLAAGVPLRTKVAGVAMGLLLDETGGGGEPIILTDILGSEDALGTMDFKVAGDEVGISAFQLDIKCEGLSLPLMREALEQARQGRLHILGLMQEACPEVASELPPGVPRLFNMEIPAKMVGRIIGPGGSTINSIISESGCTNIAVDKSGPGSVCISAMTSEAIQAAADRINNIIDEGPGGKPAAAGPPPPPINVGDQFTDVEVKNIVPFGIFVALQPGTDGFCHISELSEKYIRNIEDVELKVGDKVDAVVSEVKNGRYRIEVTSEFGIRESSAPAPGPPRRKKG